MNELTREEFLARYEAGERDFSDRNWIGIDLSGTKLFGVSFCSTSSYNNLGCWSNANLRGIEWIQCDLTRCEFSSCDFRDAKLLECYPAGMAFKDCNCERLVTTRTMTKTYLLDPYSEFWRDLADGCRFIRVNFRGAKLNWHLFDSLQIFCDCIREDGRLVPGCTEDRWGWFNEEVTPWDWLEYRDGHYSNNTEQLD